MGNTIGFITSLPTSLLQRIGISPKRETATVINLGRSRLAAPAITYSLKSAFVIVSFEFPFLPPTAASHHSDKLP